jgi:cytochrome c oxidase cbb3-type subunit I/II
MNPRQTSPGSNMPAYPWLFENPADVKSLPAKISAQSQLGIPWPPMSQHEIRDLAESQSQEIAASLVAAKAYLPDKPDLQGDALRNHLAKTQAVALIAYVQKLGTFRNVVKDHPADPSNLNPDSHRLTTVSALPTPPPAAISKP